MEKLKKAIQLWIEKLKEMWISIVLSCGVWTILVFLWEKGVRGFLFNVLNFFTGALLSINGGMLGGIIGRTLILMLFNTFISSLLIHKGPLKSRLAFAKADFKSGLQNLNEYVAAFSMFKTKQMDILFAGVLGIGLSIIWNAFISGNGAFVNTFSCIALFVILLEQFETKSGFFVAVINLGARKLGYENVCGDAVLGFIQAFMSGCLLMPVIAFFHLNHLAYIIGVALTIIGVVGLLFAKGKLKRFTAMFLLLLLLMPASEVLADNSEAPMTLKQGTVTRDKDNGTGEVFTTTLTDVVVNGVARSEEEILLYPGDVCSFTVYTDDVNFLSIYFKTFCEPCGVTIMHSHIIKLEDTVYASSRLNNFSGKFEFKDISVIDNYYVDGKVNGSFSGDYMLGKDEVGYYDMCSSCDEERYNELSGQNGNFIFNNLIEFTTLNVEFSGLRLTTQKMNVDGEQIRGMKVESEPTDWTMNVSWGESNTSQIKADGRHYFGMSSDCSLHKFFYGDPTDPVAWGEGDESIDVTPDYDTVPDDEKAPDYGMSEEEYEEQYGQEASVPLNTTVAVVASVAAAGAVATVAAPATSIIESAAGMKKKKGKLVVNGDVDIPTIHYGDHEKIMIPVNVADGDDVTWVIAAIAITPDDEKLVKAVAIPTSLGSAEIKLEIERAPKENVTTYIEVTALGVELTGEHYFHETMVEVNIEL